MIYRWRCCVITTKRTRLYVLCRPTMFVIPYTILCILHRIGDILVLTSFSPLGKLAERAIYLHNILLNFGSWSTGQLLVWYLWIKVNFHLMQWRAAPHVDAFTPDALLNALHYIALLCGAAQHRTAPHPVWKSFDNACSYVIRVVIAANFVKYRLTAAHRTHSSYVACLQRVCYVFRT